jgi:hypothetical protein
MTIKAMPGAKNNKPDTCAGLAVLQRQGRRSCRSVTEVTRTGQQHHDVALVGGIDHFLIAH